MSECVEVRIPGEPECWDSCGTCRSEALTVVELLVSVDEPVSLYQPLLVLEAYKTEMELVSPADGTLSTLLVEEGDEVAPGELAALITP